MLVEIERSTGSRWGRGERDRGVRGIKSDRKGDRGIEKDENRRDEASERTERESWKGDVSRNRLGEIAKTGES